MPAATSPDPQQDVERLEQLAGARQRLLAQVRHRIVGQQEVIDGILTAVLAGGHALLVGVPGLAKTLIVSTVAEALTLEFARIQFTPDLMPGDITGTEIIEEDRSTGKRVFRFVKGPVFANVVLADEINRTPPKTQAALLESMMEGQVTAGGNNSHLALPFFVLATQNPIEQEGTYPLPEAQLDRFMFMIRIGYPKPEQELEVVRRTTAMQAATISAVLSGEDVATVQDLVRQVPVADNVLRYALNLVRATRVRDPEAVKPKIVTDYLSWGAGPRASQYIVLAAKAKAILAGATHVMPEHIQSVAHPVLRHRIITNFNAEADSVTTDDVVPGLLEPIPVEGTDAGTSRKMDAVLKG